MKRGPLARAFVLAASADSHRIVKQQKAAAHARAGQAVPNEVRRGAGYFGTTEWNTDFAAETMSWATFDT